LSKEALIIFVKNPVLGSAKTRIAQRVGNREALIIYQKLLQKTFEVSSLWQGDKYVYYDQFIDNDDLWSNREYFKKLQIEGGLGEKMHAAFEELLPQYSKVCIIGSDCYQLSTDIIVQAFNLLSTTDVVIGPSRDGGYYLLGMKSNHKQIFIDIPWSTDQVTSLTLKSISELKLSHIMLTPLKDIDHYEDWIEQSQDL
jgi:rSAM/selenodomain-associated transferase 1